MNIEAKIFDKYRPFRNWISKFNIESSLFVIWAYSRYLRYNMPLPRDIPHKSLDISYDLVEKRVKVISEWDLNFLASEIIVYGTNDKYKAKTFLSFSEFFKTKHKLHILDEEISKIILSEFSLQELRRLSFRQFSWQARDGGGYIIRYFKIFSNYSLNIMVKRFTGMFVGDIFKYSLLLDLCFANIFKLSFPINNLTLETNAIIKKLSETLTDDFDKMKKKLSIAKKDYLNLFYFNNEIGYKPILRYESALISPIADNITHQSIKGLYYKICNEPGFDNAFGDSFQKYVGDVLNKADVENKLTIFPEENYGNGKRSIDWLVQCDNDILFLECKTKRPTLITQTSLENEKIVLDKSKIIDFITQLYKSLNDFVNNKYPSLKWEEKFNIFPMVITLEDWFIFMVENQTEIEEEVKLNLANLNIPIRLFEDYPHLLISINDFENNIQYMIRYSIKEVMTAKYSRNFNERKELPLIKGKLLFDDERISLMEELRPSFINSN